MEQSWENPTIPTKDSPKLVAAALHAMEVDAAVAERAVAILATAVTVSIFAILGWAWVDGSFASDFRHTDGLASNI